jgi:hypothetical protein
VVPPARGRREAAPGRLSRAALCQPTLLIKESLALIHLSLCSAGLPAYHYNIIILLVVLDSSVAVLIPVLSI